MPGAKSYATKLTELWKKRAVSWAHVFLDTNGRYNMDDLLSVCLAYLRVVQRAKEPAPTEHEARELQQQMRLCQFEWHKDPETNLAWARKLPAMRQLFERVVVAGMSHFDLSEGMSCAPGLSDGLGGGGVRYADIDMHGTFENRARVMEKKAREKANAVSAASSSGALKPTVAAKEDVVVAMVPNRFVTLGTRTLLHCMADMDMFEGHLIMRKHGDGDTWPSMNRYLRRVLEFVVTGKTSARLRDLHQLRSLPLSALTAALRFTQGKWSGVSANALLKEEMGSTRTSEILSETQASMHRAFNMGPQAIVEDKDQDTKSDNASADIPVAVPLEQLEHAWFKWTPLRCSWLLVLWSRQFDTSFHIDFLQDFVIQRHELVRYRDRLTEAHRKDHGRLRRPLLVEACGRWFVETCGTDPPQLQPCLHLPAALYVWCQWMAAAPFNGIDTKGRNIQPLLDEVLDDGSNEQLL
ncbi:MAG: hypothetical protein JKY23_05360 [Nitrospinaceae bacterium]|nr:hypothetical protein [Nitrospinaceae bacterium]